MAYTTARRRANRSDAAAWLTRRRGLEKLKRRGSVDDVARKSANDASAWMTRSRDMCDLHNLQNSLGAILDLISTQFSARNSRLEPENMQKQKTTFILHSFQFQIQFYSFRFFSLGFRILIFNWSQHWNIEKSYFLIKTSSFQFVLLTWFYSSMFFVMFNFVIQILL